MNESPLHFLPQDLPLLHSEGCSHFPPCSGSSYLGMEGWIPSGRPSRQAAEGGGGVVGSGLGRASEEGGPSERQVMWLATGRGAHP